MSEAGCTGVVVGIIVNIAIYIIVIGELTYLGPLWFIPGIIGGLIGGIVGNRLNWTSKLRGMMGGALGAAIAFGCMYFGLLILY
jgi:hypothetical protein